MRFSMLFIILASTNIRAQDTFNFAHDNQKTLLEIIEFEKSLNSKPLEKISYNSSFDEMFEDMIPDVKPRAFLFERANDDFVPTLKTWYFINDDSLVIGYYYRWAFYNPEFNPTQERKLMEQQKSRIKDYRTKVQDVKDKTISIIGEPNESQRIGKPKKKYIEIYKWDHDAYRTVLELVFDPNLVEIPGTSFIAGGDSHITLKTFYKYPIK